MDGVRVTKVGCKVWRAIESYGSREPPLYSHLSTAISRPYKLSTSITCTVLGPLLFILYTTPLSTLISSLSLNHHLYADDTQLFFSFYPSGFDSSITHLQDSLHKISSWMTANLLTLNSCETSYFLMA